MANINVEVEFPGVNNTGAGVVVFVSLVQMSGKDKGHAHGRVIDHDKAAKDGANIHKWTVTLVGPSLAEQRDGIANGKHYVVLAEAYDKSGAGGERKKLLARVSRGLKTA